MARPTDCTPEITEIFRIGRRKMLPIKFCCALAECSTSSYHEWMTRGEDGEQPFAEFSSVIKKAEAEWVSEKLDQMDKAGEDRITYDKDGNEGVVKGDWPARAWLLERLMREEFGRNVTKVKLTEPPASLSEIDQLVFMSEDILRKTRRGEISVEEANQVCQIIEQRRKCLEQAGITQKTEKEIPKNLGNNAIDAAKKYQEIMG